MTDEERKALVDDLRYRGSLDRLMGETMWLAAKQIEADGKRITELETALFVAVHTMDCLIGDLFAHKDCAECQENVASYGMALAECRATLGNGEYQK